MPLSVRRLSFTAWGLLCAILYLTIARPPVLLQRALGRTVMRRPRTRRRAQQSVPLARVPAAQQFDGPSLVWTMLFGTHIDARGDASVNYQYYLAESLRQARIHNPNVPFFLLTDDPARLDRERPSWAALFASPHVNVTVVDAGLLRDWELIRIEERFRDVWGPLAHELGNMMLPSVSGGHNWAFTVVTLTRLIYVHHWARERGARDVLHIENDQMVYAPAASVVVGARACGVELAFGRVAAGRAAAAVVYVSGAAALRPMVDFFWDAVSHGWEHAAAVAGSGWVTDMSLVSAFLDAAASRGDARIGTFPRSTVDDGTCLSRELATVVDAAALGAWCCGDMSRGREHFRVQSEFSDVAVWEWPLSWELVEDASARPPAGDARQRAVRSKERRTATTDGGAWQSTSGGEWDAEARAAAEDARAGAPPVLRVPVWNGTRCFNLHMHSKMLHWWRSDDADVTGVMGDPATGGETGVFG
jgi:hypothetical protein